MGIINRISQPWKYGIAVMLGATFAFSLILMAMITYGDITVSKNVILFSVGYFVLCIFAMIGFGIVLGENK